MKQNELPDYTPEQAPPSYTPTAAPEFRRSSDSISLQELEISQVEHPGSECGQCWHDCFRCFSCCSGTPNATYTDKTEVGLFGGLLGAAGGAAACSVS